MSESMHQTNQRPADRRFRWVAGLCLLVSTVVGAWLLHRLQVRLDDLSYLALTSPGDAAAGILVVAYRFFAALAVGLGLAGGWFLAVSWKTLRTEEFPPPGVPVLRDTEILRGKKAKMRGFVGLFLATMLLLLALFLPFQGPRALYDSLRPALEAAE